MSLSLQGASRAIAGRKASATTRVVAKHAGVDRTPQRSLVPPRDPGLDDRLLADIGISRADLAALWL